MNLRFGRKCILLMGLIFLSPLFGELSGQNIGEIKKVKLQLKWTHQFQFAGYYAAIEKGYYKELGIEVELLEVNGIENPTESVIRGNAEFGVTGSDILVARSHNKPVVVLASIFQHSPQILLALKSSGIASVHDLKGQRIALEPNAIDIIAYMNDEGIFAKDFTLVKFDSSVSALLRGNVDAITAYSTNEPFLMQEGRYEYTTINPQMGGVDFYGDLLFTTEDLISHDPKLVEKFIQASLKGWAYALDNTEELVSLIYNKYSKVRSAEHLRFEANKMKSMINADVVELGYSNPKRWESILKIYKDRKIIREDFTIEGLLYQDHLAKHNEMPWRVIVVIGALFFVTTTIAFYFFWVSRKLKNEIKIRKNIETQLTSREALLKSILDSSPDDITITDLSGKVIQVSAAALSLFGYDKEEELIGKNILEFVAIEDRDRAINDFEIMVKDDIKALNEYKVIHKDGHVFEIEANGDFIKSSNEELNLLVLVIRDVSARKLSEQDLRDSELRAKKQRHAITDLILDNSIFVANKEIAFNRITEVLAEAASVERASIWCLSQDMKEMKCVSLYDNLTKSHSKGNILLAENFPSYFRALRTESSISADDAQNDPRTKEFLSSYLVPLGITSMLDAIIQIEGNVVGVVCLEHVGSPRKWYPDEEVFAGNVASIVSQVLINNEKKKAQEAIIISEARLKRAEIVSKSGNWELHLDTKKIYGSEGAQKIYNLKAEVFDHAAIRDMRLPEYYELVDSAIYNLINYNKPYNIEYKIKVNTGEIKDIYSEAFLDSERRIVFGVIQDITERKKIEFALNESNEKFKAIANYAASWEAWINAKGELLWLNSFSEKLTGYTAEEYLSSPNFLAMMVDDEDFQFISDKLSEALKGGTGESFECRIKRKDGTKFWGLISWRPILSSFGEPMGIRISTQDITDRKIYELKLKNYAEELKMANDTKNRLFSIIGHDLRSPFLSLLGLSSLLVEEINTLEKEEVTEYIGQLNIALYKQYDLLNDLLNWSLMQSKSFVLKLEPILLFYEVNNIFEYLILTAKQKKIELSNSVAKDIYVFADKNMLKLVLRNLVSNAIKFTNNNGFVQVTAMQNNDYTQISVKDNGIGMSEEYSQKLFSNDINFSRVGTKEEKGTGLGLILCKEIVDKHKGRIWVESEENIGSTFSLTLPFDFSEIRSL